MAKIGSIYQVSRVQNSTFWKWVIEQRCPTTCESIMKQ